MIIKENKEVVIRTRMSTNLLAKPNINNPRLKILYTVIPVYE